MENLTYILNIKKNWELYLTLLFFWVIISFILIQSLTLNKGHIIYSLDDAYIHMAIAKNFSQYGVWGVTKEEFSSSSSSILYTLLLSFIFLFGPNDTVPLIINLTFANLIILEFYYILKIKKNLPSYALLISMILMILFIPLPFLVFTGMEHTIQIFINTFFFNLASVKLSEEKSSLTPIEIPRNIHFDSEGKFLLLLAPLVTMVRFEGIFIIIVISGLFLLRKRFLYFILILILGFLPILIFGFISISYGWYFLPNSVILKGNSFELNNFQSILEFFNLIIFFKNPYILILLIGSLSILFIQIYSKARLWNELSVMSLIFILVLTVHVFFIGVYRMNQNFSRYDGYLTTIALLLFFIFIKNYIPNDLTKSQLKIYFSGIRENYNQNIIQMIAIILIFFFLFWTFIPRTFYLLRRTPQATNNIYEQQYQMGIFLKKYYKGDCVALNDIGAVDYLADIECLDLRGLGSKEIAESIINDELDEEFVYKEAKRRDCKIAIIYEDKDYGYDIPSEWTKVGEWKIKYNVVCGDDTVSFWAVDTDEIDNLIDHLKDFSHYLPKNVVESGNYTS